MSDNENLNGLRIVSAVADKDKVVFYKDDGDTLIIRQGDPRLKGLLDQVIPITTAGNVAVISLETFNVYEDFEKKTSGFVRFFKTAKSKMLHVFGMEDTSVKEVSLPVYSQPASAPAPAATSNTGYTNAAPVASQTQTESRKSDVGSTPKPQVKPEDMSTDTRNLKADETIVAVIDGIHIPGIEDIEHLIAHALKNNSEIGVKNFLIRLSKMIDKRGHSVGDLLRFMQKGDLPIADDGSIIAYKALKLSSKASHNYQFEKRDNLFVDIHSGNVPQQVGSYVHVREELVDKNRRNECSNGLHIARRGYLGGFRGDVCVLTKIAPEDVVTVPHGDPNKVRVMGYHILGLISNEAYQLLLQNKGASSIPELKSLLADAISGKHVPVLEKVEIGGGYGTKVTVTPTNAKDTSDRKRILTKAEVAKATHVDKTSDSEPAAPILPKDIHKAKKKAAKSVKKAAAKAPAKTSDKKTAKPSKAAPKTSVTAPKAKTEPKKSNAKPSNKKGVDFKGAELTVDQKNVLKLHSEGVTPTEISKKTGISRSTLSGWIKKYAK